MMPNSEQQKQPQTQILQNFSIQTHYICEKTKDLQKKLKIKN